VVLLVVFVVVAALVHVILRRVPVVVEVAEGRSHFAHEGKQYDDDDADADCVVVIGCVNDDDRGGDSGNDVSASFIMRQEGGLSLIIF